jgi:hypothetical protein
LCVSTCRFESCTTDFTQTYPWELTVGWLGQSVKLLSFALRRRFNSFPTDQLQSLTQRGFEQFHICGTIGAVTHKTCTKCGIRKPYEDFYDRKANKNGKSAQCRKCILAKAREVAASPKQIPKTKKCGCCQQVKPAQDFYKTRGNITGLKAYCKICQDIKRKAPKRMYTKYKHTAKERKIAFELTRDEFLAFEAERCFYCGDAPEWIGLDRKDPNVGYVLSNVVRCCSICNYSKRTLSVTEWLNHLEKVLNYTKDKKRKT